MANKVLITGGAQRIGKALVKHFHQIGWNIVFQYRSSKSEAESIKNELNSDRAESCEIIQCDFDDNVSCKLFYEELESKLEGLTSLINNASTFYPKVTDGLLAGATNELKKLRFKYDLFKVNGSLEIPVQISILLKMI